MVDPIFWSSPPADSGFSLEDLYKLLHQAYQGPGHAIPSRGAAEAYLREEWLQLERPKPELLHGPEPLIEILVEEAPFVRLHLRPYRDCAGRLEPLLDAFLRSAGTKSEPAAFLAAWQRAGRMIQEGSIGQGKAANFDPAAYGALDARVRAAGYPALHHSETYLKRCRPAYRVLARAEAERLALNPKPASDPFR